jgi:phospholipase C
VPTTNEIFPGDADHPAGPYGVGIRVPMIIVSPWTRGGWVNSQLFDHTSLIRFLETRFAGRNADLIESNITPWRRAVVGDLTSAFDFKKPNNFRNSGGAAGVFQVRSADAAQDPRGYTVGSGKQLADSWDFTSGYDLSVHGPSGFFRRFKGGAGGPGAGLAIQALSGSRGGADEIALKLRNRGSASAEVTVSSRYSSRSTTLTLAPGGTKALEFSVGRTRGWYDLTVTVQGDPQFAYRYAGHLENGEPSISDPGMAGLI